MRDPVNHPRETPSRRPRRTGPGDAWAVWGGGWIFGALPMIAFIAWSLRQQTRSIPADARVCAGMYAGARSASDTAVVDLRAIESRGGPITSCGELRQASLTAPGGR